MIFAPFSLISAALLVGSWLGVLFASLAGVSEDPWWAATLGSTVAVFFAPTNRNSDRFMMRRTVSIITVLLVVAALVFRTQNIGWSEFQGDEARAMLLAERVVNGESEALFMHRKGPGEILTAAAALSVFGPDSEALLRFPFAIAGVATLCAVAAVVAHFSSAWWGIFAFLVLATDGVLLGFSRIVQYQMPMLLFAGAGWVLIINGSWRRHPAWVGIFFGASLLCHYDAIFLVLPGIIPCFLFGPRCREFRRPAMIAACAMGALAAVFYVPFMFSPTFSATAQYLAQRAGSATLPTFNFPRWLTTWEIYSGSAASFLAASLVVVSVMCGVKSRATAGWMVLGMLLAFGSVWAGVNQLAMLSSILFLAAAFSVWRVCSGITRTALCIALAPIFVFGFWFAKPNTHFLVATTPAVVLLFLLAHRSPRAVQFVTGLLVLALLPFVISHQQRQFFGEPTERPKLRTSVVEFGMGHRTGLRAAANFLADKGVTLSARTNDDELVTHWYLRNQQVSVVNQLPELLLVVQKPREPEPESSLHRNQYLLMARVLIGTRRAVDIFQLKGNEAVSMRPERVYDVAE